MTQATRSLSQEVEKKLKTDERLRFLEFKEKVGVCACECTFRSKAFSLSAAVNFTATPNTEQPLVLHCSSQAEAAGMEVVQALEPYLHFPVLRRLLTSFSNAEGGDIGAWACNPRVQVCCLR